MDREERPDEFLPPEPSGPDPELGGSEVQPAAASPDPTQQQPQQPPPPGWQAPPPGWQQPPPAWQQQAPPAQGWTPPPPGWQPPPPGWQPASGWAYYVQPREPDNGAAVAGFVTSLVAAALLVMSFGFLGILSLIASPFGIHYSRKGKRNVDEGRTPKHRGLAQAGFVIGIITLVISAIVTMLGIIFVIALATDEEFRRDFENNDPNLDSTRVQAVLLTVRLAVRLLG
jgi:hypothetical protein